MIVTEARTRPSPHATRTLAAVAALGALAALIVGGTLMSTPPPEALAPGTWPATAAWLGPTLLAALSIFDMFTVPALHQTLSRFGPVAILVATGCALTGDLLGVVGRLTQATGARVALGGDFEAGESLLELLQETLNTAGFALVAVSFTAFGILLLRSGSKALGVIAVIAGVCTALGQVPPLQPVFYVANVAFLAWYVGLFLLFRSPRGKT